MLNFVLRLTVLYIYILNIIIYVIKDESEMVL